MSLIFITFIYKINNKTFYGKYYTDYISPDHKGLDEEVKPYLLRGLNEYQIQEKLPEVLEEDLSIGIISVCNHKYISLDSTDAEINCFDFYCTKFTINYKIYLKIYINGKLIEN